MMIVKNKAICRSFPRLFSTAAKGGVSSGQSKVTGMSRFWKDTNVVEGEGEDAGHFYVTLDGRKMKTPLRNSLKLPSKPLAYLIAHEWDSQNSPKGVQPSTMPIMSLASTSIDNVTQKDDVVEELMAYLNSDTICYQADPAAQEDLVAKQLKIWRPVREWFEQQFETKLDINHGSIASLQHCNEGSQNVRNYLKTLNSYQLTAIRCITRECKSLSLGIAVALRQITAKQAIEAARIEEEFQIENWGLVEGGHDLDRVNSRVNVTSASVFLNMINKH